MSGLSALRPCQGTRPRCRLAQLRVRVDRSDPGAVDFGCDGSLEQGDGQNETIRAFMMEQDPLKSRKCAVFDSHPLANLQERPRLARKFRVHQCPESIDFNFVYRDWNPGSSDDGYHSGRLENGQPGLRIESAE
jgi:hypothetical protein